MPDKSLPSWLVRGLARILESIWTLFRIERPPPITRFEACILSVDCTLKIDKARDELRYAPLITVDQGMETCHKP